MTVSRTRWAAKKAARKAIMLGSWSARMVRPRAEHTTPTVRVLTYHGFGESVRDPWCVRSSVFEQQLRWLAERDLAVSLSDVLAFIAGDKQLKDGSVLLTMDDGLGSVATLAAPLMRRHGVPGVAYVTTSLVGIDNREQGQHDRYLTWDEIASLPSNGIEVGSHAHTHRSLGQMSLDEALHEGARSKELLEAHLDRPVTSFAYPFGMRPDETPDTARVLRELGYTSIFIAQHGTLQRGADPNRLPRVKVEGGERAWTFPLLCQGAMDAWKHVDDTLWRLQRPDVA
jgi:peptidoglycan/xylan/chitin deacetylase (PgdA/CDA1 family)